jgi:hypothetical protein
VLWRKPALEQVSQPGVGADHAWTHRRDYVWHMVQQWLEQVWQYCVPQLALPVWQGN